MQEQKRPDWSRGAVVEYEWNLEPGNYAPWAIAGAEATEFSNGMGSADS